MRLRVCALEFPDEAIEADARISLDQCTAVAAHNASSHWPYILSNQS
jgi:hypothetical protein